MSGPLKRFRIENHRGIVELAVTADGKSLTLEGANGAGKSSVLEALDWIVNEDGSDAGMRNGADARKGEMVFGEYLITRQQKRGKKPTRNTPAAALAEVRAALGRTVFSAMSEKEQTDTIRKLDPVLDVSDLDKRRAMIYSNRTAIGQVGESLKGQLDGATVPPAPTEIGEEREIRDVLDVAEIATRKAPMERQRAKNDAERAQAKQITADASTAHAASATADRAVEEARATLARLERDAEAARARSDGLATEAAEMEHAIAALVDPDPSSIDAEIAAARETNAKARAETEAHNRAVRAAKQSQRDHEAAAAHRKGIADRLDAKRAEYKAHTDEIAAIDAERARRIAAANLPIPGLSLVDGRAMFDDGKHGPVPISEGADTPNAGERMRINVAIAAALGHKLIPIRNAGLMDDDTRAAVEAFAAERGIQTISEIVRTGAPLTVVIEEN